MFCLSFALSPGCSSGIMICHVSFSCCSKLPEDVSAGGYLFVGCWFFIMPKPWLVRPCCCRSFLPSRGSPFALSMYQRVLRMASYLSVTTRFALGDPRVVVGIAALSYYP